MVSHLLTAIFTTGLLFNYQTYQFRKTFENFLNNHGASFVDETTKLTSQVNMIGQEGNKILQEIQKPLIEKLVNEGSRNRDYLFNAKPFGIENGAVKGAAVVTVIGLAYYGYQKYKENAIHKKEEEASTKI